MSKLPTFFVVTLALASVTRTATLAAEPTTRPAPGTAEFAAYRSPDGQSYFSLSLTPDERTIRQATEATTAHDVVVLFDTSASQSGPYRLSGLVALDAMLSKLTPRDRVRLLAVDLESHGLSNDFVAPHGPDMDQARARLHERVPLGSTDMAAALRAALASFEQSRQAARSVVYIGDGLSTANFLQSEAYRQLVDSLEQGKIAVSSYAVGPRVDSQALAALANLTGGMLAVAGEPTFADPKEGISQPRADQENARQAGEAGRYLAQAALGVVLWPDQARWPDTFTEVFPSRMPPLRGDRDTIIIGSGHLKTPAPITVNVTVGEERVPVTWEVTPAQSTPDHSYLVRLVASARSNSGYGLPTVGTSGLRETRRMINQEVDQLNGLAKHAIATGQFADAGLLAQAALRDDPGNPEALALQGGAEKMRAAQPNGASADLRLVKLKQIEEFGGAIQRDVVEGINEVDDAIALDGSYDDGEFVDEIEARNAVITEAIQTQVNATLHDGRRRMATEPDAVIQDLKLLLESVNRVPELDLTVRAQLVDRIEAGLREANRREIEKAELDREAQEALATVRERQRINQGLMRRIEEEKQLVDRLHSLLEEGRFHEADEVVVPELQRIDPNGSVPVAATLTARHRGRLEEIMALRAARWQGTWDTLQQVELSSIPFPDDPPIVYPDATEWEALTARRKKFATVDLKESGPAERRIRAALDEPTQINFFDTPLNEALETIETLHGIEIYVDETSLEEEGVGTETPVTLELHGVTLRSALRLLLRNLELTYLIQDEVLQITTPIDAEADLTTKVYPVADLVLPIVSNIGGGLGGGLGGGGIGGGGGQGGGGGGFGGGGRGGGGGGFGGGGGGFGGGGGGFFNVRDERQDGPTRSKTTPVKRNSTTATRAKATRAKATRAKATTVKTPARQTAATNNVASKKTNAAIQVDESVDPQVFWNDFFAAKREDPAKVRETVRQLTESRKLDHVVALIRGALRNGQAQSWMYEAMGLSLQLSGQSNHEIERALMSAADFSDSADQLMYIAQYFARIGLDARALQLARQVAYLEPMRPEAYFLGLKIANRTDDLDAIRWATVGVLKQAWQQRESQVKQAAMRTAAATLERFRKEGQKEEHRSYQKELDSALVRDCLVQATWTGDADVDLMVEEPSGTICSLRNPRTTGGGVMLGDVYSKRDSRSSMNYQEVYVCPQAYNGKYRIFLQKVWGKVAAGKVTVDVYTGYRTKDQKHERQQIALSDTGAVVDFHLDSGRRKEPVESIQVANAAKGQVALNRTILAQQLNSLSDPSVVPTRSQIAAADQLGLLRGGGAVGFQPVIIQLPTGRNFSVTGVISADRRYVRITPSFIVSDVTEVNTFTFAGAAAPVDPNAGNGGNGTGDDDDTGDDDNTGDGT